MLGISSESNASTTAFQRLPGTCATVFDDEYPAVATDRLLLRALRLAATDAEGDGVEFYVNSGWRSPAYQKQSCSTRRSRSTAHEQKLPGGSPPRRRLLTSRGTRSTSERQLPQRGCPSAAPTTDSARSTRTNPGTTSCAPTPSITVALPCTPTPRTIRGSSIESGDIPLDRPLRLVHFRKGRDRMRQRGRS